MNSAPQKGSIMGTIDRDSNDRRRYRLRELDRKIEVLRDEIIGRNRAIGEWILGDNGGLDEDKVQKLIDGMIASLKGYLALTGDGGISEDEERAYRAYLYLALTGPGEDTTEYLCGFEYLPARNFGSLVRMTDDDFLLAGSEEKLNELLGNYQGEFGDFLDGLVSSMIYRAFRFCEALWEPYPEPDGGGYREGYFSDDSHTDFVQWQYYVDKVYPAWEQYAKRLPDAERFEREFSAYKHLIFRIDGERFQRNMADMTDIWLYEQGIAVLSFGDTYGLVDDSLERKIKQLSREMKKVRMLHDHFE